MGVKSEMNERKWEEWAIKKRNEFMSWRGAVADVHFFRNRKTGNVFKLDSYGLNWEEVSIRGLISGRIVMEDKFGHEAGTTVCSNYLDVDPLTEMEVIAWAARG